MKQYSVVLLDDEELILESLQTLIDWQSLRCYIAGTAQKMCIRDSSFPDGQAPVHGP